MDTTELQNQAIEIRDAENEGENTATKVGTLLVNIIQALEGTVTEESLTETLEAVEEALQRDYASLENNTVKWHQRGVIFLKSMGSALDNIDGGSYTPTVEVGDTWFSPTSGGLVHKTQNGNEAWFVRPDAVYINSHTLRVYKWASGSMVELGSGRNPVMIDYMVSKTLDSIAVGEVFWQPSNNKLVIKTGESSVRMFSPDPSVIYCARDTKSLMFWDTTTSTWQSVGGGNAGQITNINDGQNYRIWVGTQEDLDALNGVFEDDVIYLVGTIPQAVTKFDVITSGLTHCSVPAGTPAKVTENGSFTVVVSPESGYTIDSCYATMGSSTINGVPLTGANAGKYQITINAVTANISISASASVHLQSITVTQGTRAGNAIPMNAVLNPANAENVTLQWSVRGSQYVTINQSTGLLTILEGAFNESVTVTCADTNSASGAPSGTLQLTGLSYDDSVPLVSLGAVSYTAGATANTYQFSVTKNPAGANTHSIKWDIDSVSPRGAATIDADTGLLTITNDCEVVVSAKAFQGMAQDTNINTATSGSVQLTYQLSGPIQFEDDVMHAAMNTLVKGSASSNVTYEDAEKVTNTADSSIIGNIVVGSLDYPHDSSGFNSGLSGAYTDAESFNEMQYFKEIVDFNFTGYQKMKYLTLPPKFYSNGFNTQRGSYLKDMPKIRSIVFTNGGSGGLTSLASGSISGNPYLIKLVLPNSLTTIVATGNSSTSISSCASLQVLDLRNTALSVFPTSYRPFAGCTKLKTLKFPSTLTSFGAVNMQFVRSGSLEYVEFGGQMTSIKFYPYSSSKSVSLILSSETQITGLAESDISVNSDGLSGNGKLASIYVPDSLVSAYEAQWTTFASQSKIKGISTLPADWDKTMLSITMTNVTDNAQAPVTSVEAFTQFSTTITTSLAGYSLSDVIVTMCGEDITADVLNTSTGELTIPSVEGDVTVEVTENQGGQ